jgi:putative ABC transport system permease protein
MKSWLVACRTALRRPGFVAAFALILALGIGANTAVFSMLDAVLLKPLPYPSPDRLVNVQEASAAKNQRDSLIAPGRLEDWNRMTRAFEAIAGSYTENVTDTSGSEPERLASLRVTPRFFEVYKAQPLAGRTFNALEEVAGGPGAAVISYRFWTRRFNRDPAVIGRRLILGGKGYTITGVMPSEFSSGATILGFGVDLWVPAQFYPFMLRQRAARFLAGVGRMKPGVSTSQAQDDLARVQRELAVQFPQTDRDWSAVVRDLKEFRVGGYRRALWFVFGAVALLLLIAVANIAGLMLTQLHRRARELAIRSSLGATRGQVIGGVMREVLLMSAAGVGLSCAVAFWIVRATSTLTAALPGAVRMAVDWRALVFAAVAGVLAAMICGLLPAVQATRGDVAGLLAQSGRGGSGGRHHWQRFLVAGQIALTLLLLAGAGLMLRSYYNLSHVDAGFEPARALTFHMGAAWNEDRKRIGQLQQDLLDKLRLEPGVEAAGFANFLPASGATLRFQLALDGLAQTEGSSAINVGERGISAGYLQALGAPILAGHDCPDLRQVRNGPPKALVNRRFVELYGEGQNLVGRTFRWYPTSPDAKPNEIAGVVGDLREDNLQTATVPYVYVCLGPGDWPDPEYVVRTMVNPRAALLSIRPLVRQLAPNRAVFALQTLQDALDSTLDQPRLNTRMLTLFAVAAVLLASIGLYGLLTMVVIARTREIGVRLTLGAAPRQIVAGLLASVARLLAAGVFAGLLLTAAADRFLRTVLFGVSPLDPLTLGATILLLASVAALATFAPTRRAAKIDPLEAIRSE